MFYEFTTPTFFFFPGKAFSPRCTTYSSCNRFVERSRLSRISSVFRSFIRHFLSRLGQLFFFFPLVVRRVQEKFCLSWYRVSSYGLEQDHICLLVSNIHSTLPISYWYRWSFPMVALAQTTFTSALAAWSQSTFNLIDKYCRYFFPSGCPRLNLMSWWVDARKERKSLRAGECDDRALRSLVFFPAWYDFTFAFSCGMGGMCRCHFRADIVQKVS